MSSLSGVDVKSMQGKLAIPVLSAVESMPLIFRKEIAQGSFILNSVTIRLNEINMWSEIGRKDAEILEGLAPE